MDRERGDLRGWVQLFRFSKRCGADSWRGKEGWKDGVCCTHVGLWKEGLSVDRVGVICQAFVRATV